MWRWEKKKKKQFSDKNLRSFHFGNQEKKVHLLKTFNQESGPIYQKKKKKKWSYFVSNVLLGVKT